MGVAGVIGASNRRHKPAIRTEETLLGIRPPWYGWRRGSVSIIRCRAMCQLKNLPAALDLNCDSPLLSSLLKNGNRKMTANARTAWLANIRLHPIKGLDPVSVPEARIGPNGGLELDRVWALFSLDGN